MLSVFFLFLENFYSNRESENLSLLLIYNNVASNINLFLFISKRESPYKSKSFFSSSDKESKP